MLNEGNDFVMDSKNEENQNLNILDEVNKGATMGMDAISFVSEKVKEDDFKKVLDVEYNKYKKISEQVNSLYAHYSEKDPHETSAMTKMMTWYRYSNEDYYR